MTLLVFLGVLIAVLGLIALLGGQLLVGLILILLGAVVATR